MNSLRSPSTAGRSSASPRLTSAQSRSPEKFQAAVFAFADNLRGGERGIMPLVLDILVESAAGNDYEVTGDASASPRTSDFSSAVSRRIRNVAAASDGYWAFADIGFF
jgi:hypothetical protein